MRLHVVHLRRESTSGEAKPLVGEIRFQSNCCSATDLRAALAAAVDVRISASEGMRSVSARSFEPTVLVALITASGAALGALLTGLLTLANQKRTQFIELKGTDWSVRVPASATSEEIETVVKLATIKSIQTIEMHNNVLE